MAKMPGGIEALKEKAFQAFGEKDYQWAAQLIDYLFVLNSEGKEIINLKADGLMEIAKTMVTATGKNYMNSYAIQLKEKAGEWCNLMI